MPNPPIARRLIIVSLACALLALAGGCETTPTTSQAAVVDHYQAGRYDHAFQESTRLMRHTSGQAQHEARYLAGLSAYRLGNASQAITHLSPLTSNSNPEIAGASNATLGLIYAGKGQFERSLGYYRKAVDLLKGEDLAQAYYHMGVTEQKLGRWSSARTHLSLAISNSSDATFHRAVRQRLSDTGFTLQFGAYSSQANAEKLARALRSQVNGAGIPTPAVVPSTAPSGRLYLVQAGQFATYESALKARGKLNRREVIIVNLRQP